ncbi:MAG: AAA family ATPase [Betaproteobacteria bacterium]|nr:AAA family ATPase [Betaproteobacteria bacterium]
MSVSHLKSSDLRLIIDPDILGYADTSELLHYPLSWIGQERAEMATRFGLGMMQPDYHLFVLGEVGSGRSSLLRQAIVAAAAEQPTPPDLCYLYNFDVPGKPIALHLPAGQGRLLCQFITQLTKTLPGEIAQCLDGQDFKIKSNRVEKKYKAEEIQLYAELDIFAEARHFTIRREAEQVVFTLLDKKGEILTEENLLKLPKKHRAEIELAEQELHDAIIRYFEKSQRIEKEKEGALAALRRRIVKPLLSNEFKEIRDKLQKQLKKEIRLNAYFDQMMEDILDNLALFKSVDTDEEKQQAILDQGFSRYLINLVVDNSDLHGAPVIIEDNPLFHSLFGNIEYQFENGKPKTGFMSIRAGSLHKAHGGFLMLHLDDLLVDRQIWIKLRRFLRCHQLQIEEPGIAFASNFPMSLEPEAVAVNVKIILVGSREEYYTLQEEDQEFARRFRVKVDFATSFGSSIETYHATSIFVAKTCNASKLPHFSAAAIARLLEESHREIDDQSRQSAIFARTEMLVLESATLCQRRGGRLVEASDIITALEARTMRHNYPDIRLKESIRDGDVSIHLHGLKVGQLNVLTLIDLGDHSFGTPVCITARTFAGEDGLLNIVREVEMSGPIHDKGVYILQNYMSALFSHIAPLALNASIVFEQEYTAIEGDSASCAELYVLLSSLSDLPLNQGIAVTGALNQHGEVLPVGGINDKIEGYFSLCEKAGLDGSQGVLIPERNQRHLMLDYKIVEAVEKGLFSIYTMKHVMQGLTLLSGLPAGTIEENKTISYPSSSVLGHAQKILRIFRRACQMAQQQQSETRRLPSRTEK